MTTTPGIFGIVRVVGDEKINVKSPHRIWGVLVLVSLINLDRGSTKCVFRHQPRLD